jgi:hypothetical protein
LTRWYKYEDLHDKWVIANKANKCIYGGDNAEKKGVISACHLLYDARRNSFF